MKDPTHRRAFPTCGATLVEVGGSLVTTAPISASSVATQVNAVVAGQAKEEITATAMMRRGRSQAVPCHRVGAAPIIMADTTCSTNLRLRPSPMDLEA